MIAFNELFQKMSNLKKFMQQGVQKTGVKSEFFPYFGTYKNPNFGRYNVFLLALPLKSNVSSLNTSLSFRNSHCQAFSAKLKFFVLVPMENRIAGL